MRYIVYLLFICLTFVIQEEVAAEVDREFQRAVLEGAMDMEALDEMSAENAFDTLNSCLIAYLRQSRPRERFPEMEMKIIEEIRRLPGHPALYSGWLERIAHESRSGRRREIVFEICGLVKSKELVSVVASYLDDNATYDRLEDVQGGLYSPSNAGLAARSLAAMGIDDAPLKGKKTILYTFDDVQTWKQWWNDRKDGERDRGTREPEIEINSIGHGMTLPNRVAETDLDQKRGISLWLWVVLVLALTSLVVAVAAGRAKRL